LAVVFLSISLYTQDLVDETKAKKRRLFFNTTSNVKFKYEWIMENSRDLKTEGRKERRKRVEGVNKQSLLS